MRKKLSKSIYLIPLLVACLLLDTAYADNHVAKGKKDSPIYIYDYLKDSSAPKESGWEKIVVLPFSGDPAYRRVFAELFSYYLQEQPHFEVIGPAISEIELKKRGIVITETAPGNEDILHMGEILGADAIISGSINIQNVGSRTPFVEILLFDAESGMIIAQTEQVIRSVYKISERTKKIKISAYQILSKLYELAGDPREFPILKESPPSADEGELF